jgi:hypothetical protein
MFMLVKPTFAQVATSSDLSKMPGWRIMQDSRLGNCITCHTIDWAGKEEKKSRETLLRHYPMSLQNIIVGSSYNGLPTLESFIQIL